MPGTPLPACPTCGRPVPAEPASPWRPFCSRRCRLLDLGQWLGEGYRLPDRGEGTPFTNGDPGTEDSAEDAPERPD